LVVISIIALLMSILMPSLRRARQMAKSVVCQTREKQWSAILLMYTNDNDGYFSRGWEERYYGSGPISRRMDNTAEWMDATRPYSGGDIDFGLCPEATKIKFEPGLSWATGFTHNPWVAHEPSPETGERDCGSYGMNAWLNSPSRELNVLFESGGMPTKNHWRSPSVKGAANVPMILDSWWIYAHPEWWDVPPLFEDFWFGAATGLSRFCMNRHGNGTLNGAFLDFSVRKIGIKELWTFKWSRYYDTHRGPHVTESKWPDWMKGFKEYDDYGWN
jgi:prepilin-type processing-associated H-X9-DG protein